MEGSNSKTHSKRFIEIGTFIIVGFVAGIFTFLILPSGLTKYLTVLKVGRGITVLSELDKKPVQGIYITVNGRVSRVSDNELVVEQDKDSITLSIGNTQEVGSQSLPTKEQMAKIAKGSQISAGAKVTKNGIYLISLVEL